MAKVELFDSVISVMMNSERLLEVGMTIENFEADVINALRSILVDNVERDLAKRSTVSRGYINALKNQKKPPRALTVETLFKLFPHAQITLNAGDQINGNATTGHGPAIVGHHNHVTAPADSSAEAFRHKIQDEIIRADVDPEAKVKILNIILNTETK